MSLLVFFVLLVLLAGSIWVGMSLIIVAVFSFEFFTASPSLTILTNNLWNSTNSFTMFALPLFVFMGEILLRSKISENLFKGLAPWINVLPGGLVHINIVASALFAAVSGSSAATTATVGKITLPELFKRNYDRKLVIGSLAGAGTLGFLIPPSMMMIVYGIVSGVSIGQLFIAGILPGALLATLLIMYNMVRCIIDPSLAPETGEKYTWDDRLKTIPHLAPVILLIMMVLGSIYTGFATPTEAATVGVLGSLIFAGITKSMDLNIFIEAMMGSVKTSCMIMLIVCGATYFSVAIGYLGIPAQLTLLIGSLGLSKYVLILILSIMYLFLGFILDGFSMIVMSLPLALPLILAAGFDPLWFGIYLIVMIELAQITPPVGFNLFVINGLVEDDIFAIAKAAFPSFVIILLVVLLITIFPQIVMFLPGLM